MIGGSVTDQGCTNYGTVIPGVKQKNENLVSIPCIPVTEISLEQFSQSPSASSISFFFERSSSAVFMFTGTYCVKAYSDSPSVSSSNSSGSKNFEIPSKLIACCFIELRLNVLNRSDAAFVE